MSYKITRRVERSSGGSDYVEKQHTIPVSEGLIERTILVAADDTALEVTFPLDVSELAYILFDASSELEIMTNASPGGDDTLNLYPDRPFEYLADDSASDNQDRVPFAGDLTKFFVNNVGGVATTLNVKALLDVTPG